MILGYEERGAGPLLVLVHSFPGDRRIWSPQLESLSGSRRVVAVDLPGRGLSTNVQTPAEEWSMDFYADCVAETIEAVGGGPADLAGISMGGYVLFSVWRQRRDLVRSLILVSTRSTEDPPEGKRGRKNVAALVREKGTSELIPMMFPKLFSPGSGDDVKKPVERMVRELPPETAAADSLAMGKRPDSSGELPSITVPALVLRGEHDELMPLEAARLMADRIPGARFVTIPRSAHLVTVENPKAVSEAIAGFLEQPAGGRQT